MIPVQVRVSRNTWPRQPARKADMARFIRDVPSLSRRAAGIRPRAGPRLGAVCSTHHHDPHHPLPRLQPGVHGGEC